MEPLVINYSIARHLFGLSTSRVLAFVALTLLAALFEGFGMAMLYQFSNLSKKARMPPNSQGHRITGVS